MALKRYRPACDPSKYAVDRVARSHRSHCERFAWPRGKARSVTVRYRVFPAGRPCSSHPAIALRRRNRCVEHPSEVVLVPKNIVILVAPLGLASEIAETRTSHRRWGLCLCVTGQAACKLARDAIGQCFFFGVVRGDGGLGFYLSPGHSRKRPHGTLSRCGGCPFQES
jgi:hypothetical protein